MEKQRDYIWSASASEATTVRFGMRTVSEARGASSLVSHSQLASAGWPEAGDKKMNGPFDLKPLKRLTYFYNLLSTSLKRGVNKMCFGLR